ncbi:MAG: SCO family protein [Gammaproteobacteria bacterium]|nr:SCO family protein [Gammaproteobacteria bacterium]
MLRYAAVLLLYLAVLPISALEAIDPAAVPPINNVPAITEAPPGGDFTLNSADGPVSLADFRGRLVFLFFGYTKCPDVCPTSLSYLNKALNGLTDDEQKQVGALFVSVDPKRDSLDTLKEYAGYFHPNIVGVTGSDTEIAAVADLYGARYYEVDLDGSEFGYAVNHSAVTYLITQDGVLRFIFPHMTPSQVMVDAVRHLLAGN